MNRSTSLSRETIFEARQRRRRRMQKQKQYNVHNPQKPPLQGKEQKCTTSTGSAVSTATPVMRIPIKPSVPNTLQNSKSDNVPSVMKTSNTTDSIDPVPCDATSIAFISDDDDDNKSTQSMIDKEIDSFILPIGDRIFSTKDDFRRASREINSVCSAKRGIHTGIQIDDDDDDTYDPYLLPLSTLRQNLSQRRHQPSEIFDLRSVNQQHKKTDVNNNFTAIDVEHAFQQKLTVEAHPPKGDTLLSKASKIMLDRRPVPYISIPTPIAVKSSSSYFDTSSTGGNNGDPSFTKSQHSVNDMDSIITIHQLLDGIDIIPHGSPRNESTSISISEQFQHEQQQLREQYDGQPPAFFLLLSHMYGNAYLHQYHDIERAKLWYEHAHELSNGPHNGEPSEKKNMTDGTGAVEYVDPLDQQQQPHRLAAMTGDTPRQKQPDNQLQQSLYRIRRLQRWYDEENPDIDENLLFEL
jgi:hypothetical protein